MATTKPDYKRYGFIPQRQQGLLLMRLRNRSGNLTAADLRKMAELAERFGTGEAHVTIRQGIEIPGVKEERFEEARQAILDAGLLPAVCGLRVRPVVACPGTATCPYGLVNTRALSDQLDRQYVGKDLPAKTKLAVSGCANACTKPQAHDIGFRGAAEPVIDQELCVKCGACVKRCPAAAMTLDDGGLAIDLDTCLSCGVCVTTCPKQALAYTQVGYHIYIGGKGGRYTNTGECIATFVAEEEVIPYLEAILAAYQELADKGERLSKVVARVGLATVKAKIADKLSG
ncbi:Nitrite and sulphite reductase 4Fe-4S region [uncultured Sporomusa sp.]|uniref:Nitrite and sulphite reductase 4Fe-4S region n=1 Tax=uncultured Sporomusa sp. TaxID=307249 RepID=A0A212M0T7_9FIRM|nr:4Fe-4S dicluster domain-containing protein [uncultured Sporomusa sp.]SCM83388.1 Nitrite and sulphite reductase 4Fe-4S region [uncultured Sporomusa sp.]